MQHFSIATKGRKKEVEKFTPKQGLWILGILMLLGVIILLLMVSGLLHVA